MIKYRKNKRSYGFCVEEQTDGYSWKRCAGPFKHSNSAAEKLRRLRDIEKQNYRGNIGQKVIASMPFCSKVMA